MSVSRIISTHTTENSSIPTVLDVTVLHTQVTYNHMATNRKQTKGNLARIWSFPSEFLVPLQNLISCHVC